MRYVEWGEHCLIISATTRHGYFLYHGTTCFIIRFVALIPKLFLFSRLNLFQWYALKFGPPPPPHYNNKKCQTVQRLF